MQYRVKQSGNDNEDIHRSREIISEMYAEFS